MEKLLIGKIRSSHGVRGEVKIYSYSGEAGHFNQVRSLEIRKGAHNRVFEIESVRGAIPHLLIKFRGIDLPEEARKWASAEIWAEREHAARKAENEFYTADLEGCELFFEGATLARVVSLVDAGADDLIEVETSEKKRVLIPFRSEFIGDVDTEQKRIELKVDWILE